MTQWNKLECIFQLQKELRRAIGGEKDFLESLSEEEKGTWTRNYLDYLRQEIAEAYDCLAYKHWDEQGKKCRNKILKPENLKIELIDMIFFLLDLMTINNIGADDIFYLYLLKWKKNMDRQKTSYNVLTKTEDDNLTMEEQIREYYAMKKRRGK